jgi:hypothetical protein
MMSPLKAARQRSEVARMLELAGENGVRTVEVMAALGVARNCAVDRIRYCIGVTSTGGGLAGSRWCLVQHVEECRRIVEAAAEIRRKERKRAANLAWSRSPAGRAARQERINRRLDAELEASLPSVRKVVVAGTLPPPYTTGARDVFSWAATL